MDDTLSKLPPPPLANAIQAYLTDLARRIGSDTDQELVVTARSRVQDATADLVTLAEALSDAEGGRKSKKTLAAWLEKGAPDERHRDLLDHLVERLDDGMDDLEDTQRTGGLRTLRLAAGSDRVSLPVFLPRLAALLESLQETLEEWASSGLTEDLRERIDALPESISAADSMRPPAFRPSDDELDEPEDDLEGVDLEEHERGDGLGSSPSEPSDMASSTEASSLLQPSSLLRIAELLAEEDEEAEPQDENDDEGDDDEFDLEAELEDADLGDEDLELGGGTGGDAVLLALAREMLGGGDEGPKSEPPPREAPLVGKLRGLIEELTAEGGLELASSAKPAALAERLADALDELSRHDDPAAAVLDWFLDQDEVEEVFFDAEDLGRRLAALD